MGTELVTGGAGFLGGAYVRNRLGEPDAKLVVLDKLTYAASRDAIPAESDRLAFVQGDIVDASLVGDLLSRFDIERIVHFAAETHVDRSIDDPVAFAATNVLGTAVLLDQARRWWSGRDRTRRDRFRFVQVSTDEVFGQLGSEGRFRVGAPYAPRSPYAASKAGADHFVRAFHATYGLPTIVVTASNLFGPYQFPEKLIPLLTANAIEGRPLPIYGDGSHVREWLHVDDLCRGITLAWRRGEAGRTYLMGGGQECANRRVAEAVCDAVDRLLPSLPHRPCRSLITYVPDRPGHDARYALDHESARRELGWCPSDDFAERLEATVRWYIDHAEWLRGTTRHYDRRRLGQPRHEG
ncbi:MAG: dTDP-glucose 4,6-dehydratase [Planctomycetes bacterium]|nr:dTDP-glucose 4,6-dehydratase [Planctomycetota bacterium]